MEDTKLYIYSHNKLLVGIVWIKHSRKKSTCLTLSFEDYHAFNYTGFPLVPPKCVISLILQGIFFKYNA